VIVDANEAKLGKYAAEGWLTIAGDSTQESVLRQAQIERAVGLVAATTTDATNIYIVLTARGLNPKLKIIARASEEDAEKHLKTAGADIVIYLITSRAIESRRHSLGHMCSISSTARLSIWVWTWK
jgi:voltage-gated potassium channel